MNKLKNILLLIAVSLTLGLSAKPEPEIENIEMADWLYSSGKIYVVIAVIAVIFIGIIFYLISIDKKVSKLEKEIKNK